MPTGIPKRREINPNDTEELKKLKEAAREIDERIRAETARGKAHLMIVDICVRYGISAKVLRNIAADLADRKVSGEPVFTRKRHKLALSRMKPAKGKVGKVIRAARLKLNMADAVIGKHLGVHHSSPMKWQSKGSPVPERYHAKLIELLKLPANTFANGRGQP
jgi:DNA-binding transcriptional regulator YiaG